MTSISGELALSVVENHHNYAWLSERDGRKYVVHRKGATPAERGVLGVIPGSMAAPGYVVSGKGDASSILSAPHGAGRAMSRGDAKRKFTWKMVRPELEKQRVKLLAAGIDENPFAYKSIAKVMSESASLVDVIGELTPRVVRMADAGERPEDERCRKSPDAQSRQLSPAVGAV